jgi:hypothetical protein
MIEDSTEEFYMALSREGGSGLPSSTSHGMDGGCSGHSDHDDGSTAGAGVATIHRPPIDVSYAAPQVHEIVNVALHWEYFTGIIFIFSQGRKDLYHV